jgi:hypothetical protein
MCAATADFVGGIFGERPVAISNRDGGAEIHIAEAIQTAGRDSDQGSFESVGINTRRL